MISPRIHHSTDAVASWLNSVRGTGIAQLQAIAPEITTITVLPYFTMNVSTPEYPYIMLEQLAVKRDWEALDMGSGPPVNVRFTIQLWGSVAGFDDKTLDDLASELEGWTADTINAHHLTFEHMGRTYFFNETMPMAESKFGLTKIGQNLVRGFQSTFTVDSIVTNAPEPGTLT